MGAKMKEAIELYNQRPHRKLFGLSPNQALYLKHGNKHPNKPDQLIVRNDNSELDQETTHSFNLVATHFQNNWLALMETRTSRSAQGGYCPAYSKC